mmetsp:Transcript_13952/g.34469  ORF Transcript_13952/g.34469 Transcript_13952/m.34469 type:complete len:263 (-) Transcript_13952:195-983(-)|eukprot:CAMPEP_0178992450 /NCGR_PEP_ID=MMETSP0795-20121207/6120_1 /TAXON_ID=88552 /ORGANISM="Amoebophrya sp., Strain Ameob2" /LENGTH=262 /DNA_ID=CAMNT_0020684331 /DNA_START=205 /DNA_END=993 /DNA_ORIENTATION=+
MIFRHLIDHSSFDAAGAASSSLVALSSDSISIKARGLGLRVLRDHSTTGSVIGETSRPSAPSFPLMRPSRSTDARTSFCATSSSSSCPSSGSSKGTTTSKSSFLSTSYSREQGKNIFFDTSIYGSSARQRTRARRPRTAFDGAVLAAPAPAAAAPAAAAATPAPAAKNAAGAGGDAAQPAAGADATKGEGNKKMAEQGGGGGCTGGGCCCCGGGEEGEAKKKAEKQDEKEQIKAELKEDEQKEKAATGRAEGAAAPAALTST